MLKNRKDSRTRTKIKRKIGTRRMVYRWSFVQLMSLFALYFPVWPNWRKMTALVCLVVLPWWLCGFAPILQKDKH
jgi:hypothetical protein